MQTNIVSSNVESSTAPSVAIESRMSFQGELQPHEFQELLRQAWLTLSAEDSAPAKPEHKA